AMLVSVPMASWAPSAAAIPNHWPSPLAPLHALLAGFGPGPSVPHQAWGAVRGLDHQVPPRLTRAGRGQGMSPGKGAGELPPYQPHRPGIHEDRTGPGGRTG